MGEKGKRKGKEGKGGKRGEGKGERRREGMERKDRASHTAAAL